MTKIHLKGLLSIKFGSFFKINISSIQSALKAIDCNRVGFLKEIFSLSKNNYNYFIICDGHLIENENQFIEKRKIENIYIIPAITGSGSFVAAGMGLAVESFAFAVVTVLVNVVIATAISLAVSAIMASINNQGAPPQKKLAVGGATAQIEALGKSYIFSNDRNRASQGASIPIGYGKIKHSSNVLMISIKNYSTNQTIDSEFKTNENSSVFLDYLTN